jgi:hypothetical protein
MFITYEGQTVTINNVWWDRTVDIIYTNSDGETVSERVDGDLLDGFNVAPIDWDTVQFECKVQSFKEWEDFEFQDKEFQTKRICVSYNREADYWNGNLLFIDENDEWTKDVILSTEDVMRLKDLIPSASAPVKEYETLYVVTERYDQYVSMDIEVFSNLGDALVLANRKVGEFPRDYFNHVESEPRHDWYMWENTDEGTSIRLEAVQKDERV